MSDNCGKSITELGNPAKPQGHAGEIMLTRMNVSHYDVTGWAMEFLEISGSESILDIGCGGGETLRRLSMKTSGHLTGVDYSAVSTRMSRELNFDSISSGKMTIADASVENLPFADGTFDRIITVESFYFWKNPQQDLKEVYRVLAGKGIFLIVADIYGGADLSDSEIENIRRYKLYNPAPEEFEKLLTNAGFSDVRIHTKSGTNWICAEGRK